MPTEEKPLELELVADLLDKTLQNLATTLGRRSETGGVFFPNGVDLIEFELALGANQHLKLKISGPGAVSLINKSNEATASRQAEEVRKRYTLNPNGLDTPYNTTDKVVAIKAANIGFVIRYISSNSQNFPTKQLTLDEANTLRTAGLRVVMVYETNPTSAGYFQPGKGTSDAVKAIKQAVKVGATEGCSIFFAVDFDAPNDVIKYQVLDYFKEISNALQAAHVDDGQPLFAIGVYGSGNVCNAVKDADLASYTWLAQSTGWGGYDPNGTFTIIQDAATNIAGLDCDRDLSTGPMGELAPL